jgi:hypothetical protein
MSDDVTKCMSVEYDVCRARGKVFSDLLAHIGEREPSSRPTSEPADSAEQCDLELPDADTGGE